MKIFELIVDEAAELLGFDANSLVGSPAHEESFYAFKEQDVEDLIVTEMIKREVLAQINFVEALPGESKDAYVGRCIPQLLKEGYDQDQAAAICYESFACNYSSFQETDDVYELKIGDYQTRHYDMCPGAADLYKKIESGEIDVDMGLAIRAAKLQDSLFWLEKHTVKQMGKATYDDVVAAQNLAYEIMQLAEMMGLTEEHQYIYSHIQAIRDLAGETGFDMDVTGLPDYISEIPKEKFESYTDYPEQAKENARIALRYAEENGWGDCGTPVGKARANQLAKGEPISEDTISRMASFARHRENGQKELGDGCGRLMWLAWGGDAGVDWAKRKLESIREEMSTKGFAFASEEQQIVVGPLMVPNKLIMRVNEKTGEAYQVYFTEETIATIAEGAMRDDILNRLNVEHDPSKPVEGHMISTWIVKDPEMDTSRAYGFKAYPKGTWFGMYRVLDKDVWAKVKAGEVTGFSIEAYLSEKLVKQ